MTFQTSMMESFCENSQPLKGVSYFCKNLHLRYFTLGSRTRRCIFYLQKPTLNNLFSEFISKIIIIFYDSLTSNGFCTLYCYTGIAKNVST